MKDKINKFKIGDKVKIILNGVNEDYPKVYKIKKVLYSCHGYFAYRLQGVPDWFREEHLEFANE